jgi:hypothetical protein
LHLGLRSGGAWEGVPTMPGRERIVAAPESSWPLQSRAVTQLT